MAAAPTAESHEKTSGVDTPDGIEVISDSLSLKEKDEKEVIENPNEVTADAQLGVQKAEAAALVWSKQVVYAIYAWIWLCFFILSLQLSISSNMIYFAYADFASAPQISQAYLLSTIIGGVLQLPIAKTLNLWGRAEGFLVFLGVFILGLIIIASCNGPNTFAAGYTLYWIGYTSISFILSVFVADTSGLRNRAFTYAFIGTPSICTAFVGPLAYQSFLETSSWQWSYGSFAIIIFFTFMPLALVFKFYQSKAEKMGLFVRNAGGRTALQSLVHYIHEFDVIGGSLLMAAFVLSLLPFSLEIYGYSGYSSPTFISMVVIGVLLFPAFAVWERYFASTQFIKWELFKKRTVLGACLLSAVIFFNYYTWDQYYYYYVQVVYDLSASNTAYMTQTYAVGSSLWAVVFGLWIRQTKHFKNTCLFFGAPLLMLGGGLMIYFRGSESKIGYLIMCQIFIAFGGGTLIIGDEMAGMAAADRDGIPLVLAMLGLSSSLGGAIGYAVAFAIYSNTFPQTLLDALPDDSKADFDAIYLGGSTTQLLYPAGSAARDAINYAWAQSQKYECIAATVILVLAFPAILMWKNYNVDRKQNKGIVI